MHLRENLAIVVLGTFGLGCSLVAAPATNQVPRPAAVSNSLPWIRVSTDGHQFAESESGRKFTPWGFNYDRDYKSRLLEEYWDAEWQTVGEDFREMKALGANVVRVHLQFAKFMDAPDKPDPNSLRQLERLTKLAEKTGLYLDLTGLACYRKSDTPRWYDEMTETNRWRAQANFWAAIAEQCKDSPAIFCYDLMNEPFVPIKPRAPGDWLTGKLSDFYFVQALTLTPAGRTPPQVVEQWASQLVAAIRKHDQRHAITLGMLPNSGAAFVKAAGRHLDFISVHEYPQAGKVEESLERLKVFNIGKPLVIEEMFPLNCSFEEMKTFLGRFARVRERLGEFLLGQTPEELARAKGMAEAILGEWLKEFQELKPRITR